ncbi:DUF6435 family protein [Psychrosphaera aquimarina]|jgi:hypothetical protein|uniref:DUF6435 family protein n=1 Tax=Psychrosphaera aquimarina TaxID=2044854 RepID=A0ABU3R3T0_9GAMM|nr:DUF6435 family protein [Psychrosphaera aquimarina]MDU0114303.1 DUF6435 family protein [Psychrosphaera aquimarina]
MFSFFKKDPTKKLNKLYDRKLEEAMLAQRNGNIRAYAMITAEAEKIREQILEIDPSNKI